MIYVLGAGENILFQQGRLLASESFVFKLMQKEGKWIVHVMNKVYFQAN